MFILASASPRRQELLERAGIEPRVEPASIDETRREGELPTELVARLAAEKACAWEQAHGGLGPRDVLLAADTLVWKGDDVLGKPRDDAHARAMLRSLSGQTHRVSTGVCIVAAGTSCADRRERVFVETTEVVLRKLSDAEIDAYLATGEYRDKAGSYAIQGGAASFVEALSGDYDNVVGLPVQRVLDELRALGVSDDAGVGAPASITRIPGVFAAHATDAEGGTGCTVIVCPEGAIGATDVRGGAPATRETDLLRPEETVECLHAVVLAGGSAFGLAASCGVAEELEAAHIGLNVGVTRVPIVSGACLFDLAVGDVRRRPTVTDGALAARRALKERGVPAWRRTPLERGNVGAGTGCTVGKLAGPARAMKTGLGEAVRATGPLVCGAVVAVNACGDVVDPATGSAVAGLLNEDGTAFASSTEALLAFVRMPLSAGRDAGRENTTISCVITNARLTKAQATKVAQMAADAYAHAIRPVHTTNDGDAVFVLATGACEVPVDVVGVLATQALEAAIVDAATQARGAYGLKAACDLA